jgi:hypothetical protein
METFWTFLQKNKLILSLEYNPEEEYPWEASIKNATIMKYGREQTRSATSDSSEGAIKYLIPLLRGTIIKINDREDILVPEELTMTID